VISWDSAVGKDGRSLHLNPSSNELIGNMCLKLAAAHLPDGKGDFAILSATSTSTNQNTWIAEMKKQLPRYPGLNLVTTVYGDDLADKSYREAQGLLTTQPNVKVIVAPTTVGVLAASQAVKDAGKIGQVYVTGLGLPSEMAGAVHSGATREFAIWNPIDLGYSATQIAYRLVKKETEGKPGSEINAGRMGKIKIGENGEAAMADPFVYNKSNVDEFAKIF
jgi:rhamnose transport system substrate-binding protein